MGLRSPKTPNSSLPKQAGPWGGGSLTEGSPKGRGGAEWRVRNALSARPVLPTSSLERITSCYCVDREGQELGRAARFRLSERGREGGAREPVTVGLR